MDLGRPVCADAHVWKAQQALRDAGKPLPAGGMRTLVLGGGHETTFGTLARGVLDAFAQESVGIINLDAHLDLRQTDRATSRGRRFVNWRSWRRAGRAAGSASGGMLRGGGSGLP